MFVGSFETNCCHHILTTITGWTAAPHINLFIYIYTRTLKCFMNLAFLARKLTLISNYLLHLFITLEVCFVVCG